MTVKVDKQTIKTLAAIALAYDFAIPNADGADEIQSMQLREDIKNLPIDLSEFKDVVERACILAYEITRRTQR